MLHYVWHPSSPALTETNQCALFVVNFNFLFNTWQPLNRRSVSSAVFCIFSDSLLISVCLFVCLLSVCLFLCLSSNIWLSVCLSFSLQSTHLTIFFFGGGGTLDKIGHFYAILKKNIICYNFISVPIPLTICNPQLKRGQQSLGRLVAVVRFHLLHILLLFAEYFFRNYNVRFLEKRKMFCRYTHMRFARLCSF